ncbi:GIY-YIG nuclease family protein [Nitrosomonas sp.]|uniref:GIY-YIG nuclease family protein n=1 Tax=Nitrosomonas sp. TaxID=42353 RepID=UPI00208059FB|nr:GIY-YIG nuclease family protein [Nitrosomonas sp.]GJL74497.1 MAG: hypothetical protein NMNS02_06030 [Nitrosomonas sp.]
MKQIYKITYLPTNKIYIGKVAYESFRYFGSPDIEVVNEDFYKLPKEIQKDYTVRKEILWESEDCSDSELAEKEVEFIRKLNSNNPEIGYNRWPKFNENT